MTQIDGRYVGGVNTYSIAMVQNLLKSQQFDIIIFCTKKNIKFISREIPDANLLIIRNKFYSVDVIIRHLNYRCFNSSRIHKLANQLFSTNLTRSIEDACQILYTPTNYTKYFNNNVPQFVSLHDIQEKTFPKNFKYWVRNYRNLNVETTLEFSKNIIVSSEFIKHDIRAKYRKAKFNSFFLLHEGVDKAFYNVEANNFNKIRKSQVILPAHHWPHKNHLLLIEAINKSLILKNYTFLFTGPKEKKTRNIQKKIDNYNLTNIQFTGKISQTELREKYLESLVVISCSRFESSSLPILEGLACGCKAIASDIPAHKEMQQFLEIDLFKDDDVDALKRSLEKLLLLIERGKLDFSKPTMPSKFEWSFIALQFEKFLFKQLI